MKTLLAHACAPLFAAAVSLCAATPLASPLPAASAKTPAAAPRNAAGAAPAARDARTDTSQLVPLPDLTSTYKGEEGGLYGGGRNEPPAAHQAAYLRASARVEPLDAEGRPAAAGKIGLISIGFSNSSMEWVHFKQMADADPEKSPHVVIVNGAIGGRAAVMWAWDGADILPKSEQERLGRTMDVLAMPRQNRKKTATDGGKDTWPTLDLRLKEAGITPKQVQVAWMKHVDARPQALGEFPVHARTLQADMADILIIAKSRLPNLRVAYFSSRTYGGWSSPTSGSPEPYAYECGFAVRWLIQTPQSSCTGFSRDSRWPHSPFPPPSAPSPPSPALRHPPPRAQSKAAC